MNNNSGTTPDNQSTLTINDAYLQAIDHYNAKRYTESDKLCTAIIQAAPNHIDAINLLGVIAQQVNRHDLAIVQFQRALDIDNSRALLYFNLGTSLYPLGRREEAVQALQTALEKDPENSQISSYLNRILDNTMSDIGIGDAPVKAEDALQKGAFFYQSGQLDEAIYWHQIAIEFQPENYFALSNLGFFLQTQGKLDEAIVNLQKAISIKPNFAEAHNNLGLALRDQGKLDEAVASYNQALIIKPDYAVAHNNMGNVLKDQGKLDEAVSSYKKAIAIKPDNAKAHYNLGNVLKNQDKLDESVASFKKAIAIKPNYAKAYYNLGITLKHQRKWDVAIASLQKAAAIKPDYSEALGNLGLILLLTEKYESGWEFYEWRKGGGKIDNGGKLLPHIPLWSGSSLKGKNIMIHMEQGIGDEIMYSMFLFYLEKAANNIIVAHCDDRLIPLFQRTFPKIIFLGKINSPDQYISDIKLDYQSMLGSIPRFYEGDWDVHDREIGVYKPNMETFERLQSKYNILSGSKKVVGISWKTNNPDSGELRSISLEEMLSPIIDRYREKIFFVNLQYGNVANELIEFSNKTGYEIYNDQDVNSLNSLEDFAAQVATCDLIISIDNSTVHFGGCLGRPTWVLLPFIPEFRWLFEGSSSRWYKSLRLFRQESRGKWQSVIEQINKELDLFLN